MRLSGILVPLKRTLSSHSASKHAIAPADSPRELIWGNAGSSSCSRAASYTLPSTGRRASSEQTPVKGNAESKATSPQVEAKPARASSKNIPIARDKASSSAEKPKRGSMKTKAQAQVDIKPPEAAGIKIKPSGGYGYEPFPAQMNPAKSYGDKLSPAQFDVGESSIPAAKPKKSARASSSKAKAVGNVNNADDVKVSVKTSCEVMVSAKKVQDHAKVKAEVSPKISETQAKAKPRVRSPTCQAEAKAAVAISEARTTFEAKPRGRSPRFQAKAKVPTGSVRVSDMSMTFRAKPEERSPKYQAEAKAAVGISEVSSTSEEKPGGKPPRCQAEAKAAVGAIGISEVSTTFEVEHTSEQALADESPMLPEVSTALKDRDTSDQAIADESKKASFCIAFPVKVFSAWWISCFMQSTEPFTDLTFPLSKTHVWVAAYQRVHLKVTGSYIDGQSVMGLIKHLRDLQYTVTRGQFKWADKKHVYLPSPVVDTDENSSAPSQVQKSPTFQDDVVQEVLLLILEPIFEARFSSRSHAWRPGRDAHTALRAVQRSFPGCVWFISGNANILHEEVYATRVLDCVLRVVRDMRVASLLKSGLLVERQSVDKVRMISNWGSCSRLRHLLCNAFLDQLDWWMDKQILSLSSREQPSFRCSSSLLFRPATVTIERPRRIEYVRYGTEFLVACNGSREEAEKVRNNLQTFSKQKLGMGFSQLTISHISSGVTFLDHIISQKVVHPIISRRMASNGRVFEKRALGIRLSLKASRECCLMHLKELGFPTSSQHIKEMLSVLNNWYYYAQNRQKVIEFCKYNLCLSYAKGAFEEHKKGSKDDDFAKHLKKAMLMAGDNRIASSNLDRVHPTCKEKIWVPEHEKLLRNLAWLQDQTIMTQVTDGFRKMRKLSSQQHMSQVVWEFLRGFYPSKGDYCWEPETQLQTSSWAQGYMDDLKNEELAQSAG